MACWVRYGLIGLMFSNAKRHDRATEATKQTKQIVIKSVLSARLTADMTKPQTSHLRRDAAAGPGTFSIVCSHSGT